MKTIRIIFALISCAFLSHNVFAQQISQKLWGQNFWNYHSINANNPFQTLTYFDWSGATVIRLGGADLNTHFTYPNMEPKALIKQMVLDVKNNNNMIPIVQIPLGTRSVPLDINVDVIPYAESLIQELNQFGGGSAPFTLYWSIGNEPDIDADDHTIPSPFFNDHGFTISQIHSKITAVMNAMVNYQSANYPSNPSLIFIGPELSYYRDHPDNTGYSNMITNLTSGSFDLMSNNTNNLDYFSFHYYATADQGIYNANTIKPDRNSLLRTLRDDFVANWATNGSANPTYVTSLATNLNSLKNKLNGTNAKIAITEANICTANSVPGSPQSVTNDTEAGNGANSFLAGQFYTELAGLCMEKGVDILNYWSMSEGSSGDTPTRPWYRNIGMYDSNTGSWYYLSPYGPMNNGIKQSWWHLWAMAQVLPYPNPAGASLYGWYVSGANVSISPSSLGYAFKAFGSRTCGRYAVVLINQTGSAQSVKINLGNTAPTAQAANVVGYMDMLEQDLAEIHLDLNTSYYDYNTNPSHAKTDMIQADETVIIVFDKCGNIINASRLVLGSPADIFWFGPYTPASCNCE
jgi:hypothetical protein